MPTPTYSPPTATAVTFNFKGAYTPPVGTNVTFNFTVVDAGGGTGPTFSRRRQVMVGSF